MRTFVLPATLVAILTVATASLLPAAGLVDATAWHPSEKGNDASTPESAGTVADVNPPTIVAVSPTPGDVTELTQITVTFSETVAGVTAGALLVNGASASAVTGTGNTYTFSFARPLYGGVYISWAPNHTIVDRAVPPNRFNEAAPGSTWQYLFLDRVPPTVTLLFPAPSITVRALTQIEVTFSEPVTGVSAGDLLINGQPATNVLAEPVNRYVFQFAQPPAGPVQFSWVTGHDITDLATTPNPFAGMTWSHQLDPDAPPVVLVINEIVAANEHGLEDEDLNPATGHGEPQDWIEIYNPGSTSVNLAGWSLSDDPDVPGQWVFPSRTLAPGQHLVVFASGKNRAPSGTGNLHTNFKLSSGGEFLGLFSGDSPRAFVSGFAPEFPEQRNDTSYGFDNLGQLRYFANPTPGAPNGTSTILAVADPVHFSVTRGHFTRPFSLHLTTATPGGTIRYTTNGTVPTLDNGRLYLEPIPITGTTLLRAVAFKKDFLPSTVATHTYLFNQSPAIRSLPTMSIVTDQNHLTGPTGIIGISNVVQQGDGTWVPADATGYHNPSKHGLAWERPTSVEYVRPEDNSGFQIDCGIRVQGSDWQRPRTTPGSKFSYRLYFRGDYGPGRLDYPLYPDTTVQEFDQVVLRAGFNDNSNPFIRDELTRRLSHDQGDVASHGTFVTLFVNGVYKGYFNPCERVHEEFLQSYLGGTDEWDVVGPSFAQGAGVPGVIDGDRTDFQALVSYIRTQSTTSSAVYQTIGQRLDLVNFVDYLLLNAYCAMGDWPQNNWRAGKDRGTTGPWRFIVWDGEWSMGIYGRSVSLDMFAMSGPGPNEGGLASINDSEIAQMYQRLRLNPEFRLLWADRVHKHLFNGGALTDTNIVARFNAMRAELSGVISSMDQSILTTWVPQRRPILLNQLNANGLLASSNAPGFNQFGGRVPRGFGLVMTNLTGTIYHTTDGSDPRVMFTSAVAPSASTYTGPLTLNQSVVIKARSRSGANWSALTEARFDVAVLGVPIRITEIHYNPPDGNAYEFLELLNAGSATIDLSGMHFDGFTFQFNQGTRLAPGATVVLVSDTDTNAFLARYPGRTIGGVFSGQLANGGERITLLDANGQTILTVDYDDENGWPTDADGGGSSLEIVNPLGDPDDPANWRASGAPDGTPGPVSPPPALGPIVLNELMATNRLAVANGTTHPDWIELRNLTASPVNLTDWSLTDSANPRKYVFPPGTTIQASSYLVVWCDDSTNTTPGLHTGFALDTDGESVFLFNASTSLVDAVSFGLQLADHSLGRIGDAWLLNTATPNAANLAAPVASPFQLAINEWLANPVPGEPDWLELMNRSASLPVSLQGVYLTSTNGIHQLNQPAFLAPGGFVQLFADEDVGWNHLDFRIPAAGGILTLHDPLAVEVNRIAYAAQTEGVSQGRLPNGTGAITSFPGSVSPGAGNYVRVYTGPYLNEVLARNIRAVTNSAGRTSDFIDLYNPGTGAFDLSGMSLSIDSPEPGQWIFPAGTTIAGQGFLVVWCDSDLPATLAPGPFLNTGRSIDGESGAVYLFDTAGHLADAIEFGPQLENLSIGRVGSEWRLVGAITPGSANAAAATLGTASALRLNEWMASGTGDDWFELHNPTSLPMGLGGLYLSDDLSQSGATRHPVAPLSFIGPGQWVKFIADGRPDAGRNHVNFSLNGEGESIRLYSGILAPIDTVSFGRQQFNVSEGRWPDGGTNLAAFPGSASPGAANYRLIENVVINEVLAHNAAPLEAAIELHNPTVVSVNLGGWFLSDSATNLLKFRIPDGTIISGGGFAVLYEDAFNSGSPGSLSLSIARGGELWLSATDTLGTPTGYRVGAEFGPSLDAISHGRVSTSHGVEFVALGQRTFGVDNPSTVQEFRQGTGLANAGAAVGPVVINEIMYHPSVGTNSSSDDEYIELHNPTASAVPLHDPAHPTNHWRLADAIEFTFVPGASIPSGGHLLVVSFDPLADPISLANFRARYGLSAAAPVVGPYRGRLDNAGENVELRRPGTPQVAPSPDAGLVPDVLSDRVNYDDAAPWPSGLVAGGGLSIQRREPLVYGNEPTNWVASMPTPGAANGAGIVPPPTIAQSPADQSVLADSPVALQVVASGAGPLAYQWRCNGLNIDTATNATLTLRFVQPEQSGFYDAVVSNPGGAVISQAASLLVRAIPEILLPPTNQAVRINQGTTLSVVAKGSAPLAYHWRFNGTPIPGETNATLVLTNLQLEGEGTYEVEVSNTVGQTRASANIVVLEVVAFVVEPLSQSVVEGGDFSVSAAVSGNPAPYSFSWRRVTAPAGIFSYVDSPLRTNLMTFNTAAIGFVLASNEAALAVNCRLVISNAATSPPGFQSRFTITVLRDSDLDGLPDTWETAYEPTPGAGVNPAIDHDGDGMTNGEEYTAGTDPNNPLSLLEVRLEESLGMPAVIFGASSNQTYTVEFTDHVSNGPWAKLGDVVAQSADRVETMIDPGWNEKRFYRVVTPHRP